MKYFLGQPWSKDDTMVLVVGFACLVAARRWDRGDCDLIWVKGLVRERCLPLSKRAALRSSLTAPKGL